MMRRRGGSVRGAGGGNISLRLEKSQKRGGLLNQGRALGLGYVRAEGGDSLEGGAPRPKCERPARSILSRSFRFPLFSPAQFRPLRSRPVYGPHIFLPARAPGLRRNLIGDCKFLPASV